MLVGYLFYLRVKIEGGNFNLNKSLNLEGRTGKYGSINRPIIAHVVSDRYIIIV